MKFEGDTARFKVWASGADDSTHDNNDQHSGDGDAGNFENARF